ncbi:Rieske (2Fe-2S) protein [Sphaerisporangium sp. TRM90804]|uniref:Rieske (2Fe-2S) protein n=1 Tax=Sphaerisporangium sp. TRM90804 TaxID=3031113 RepID=UPI00244C16A0|nr:Rieske (2Fe-2S) protein [Sphaerisporangium sp. TRM90804]MDH2426748.1 Rieske (2Fe-2S) protein [Sphaerisporangium sp. TRM90804]
MEETSKSINSRRRTLRETLGLGRASLPVGITDRIEHLSVLDKVNQVLANAVRHRLPAGSRVRDVLHGVPTGHPLHPPLATVSLGCWIATAVLDMIDVDPRASRAVLATGIAGALPTAAAGITDWSVLHREQQRVGFVHAVVNLTALGLYSGSLFLRMAGNHRAGRLLGYAGLGAAGLGGYLGGHLAYRMAAGPSHAEPLTHLMPLGWHDLCRLWDLPDGRPVTRRLGYIHLFVLRHGAQVKVLADRCSHLAGPLHQGRLAIVDEEACVICPWHGSVFRIDDGTVVHGPATAPQPSFDVNVRGDGVVQVRPRQA